MRNRLAAQGRLYLLSVLNRAIAWTTGLGAITHIKGPSDATFNIQPGSGQIMNLRDANGTTRATINSSGVSLSLLTAGTMSAAMNGTIRRTVSKFSWTNAMVVTAAGTSNKIDVCTLPAKTVVTRCWVVIDTAATQAATLTVQVGSSSGTTGFVVASNAKAAANTVYGDSDAEVGTNLFDAADDHWVDYLPSYTSTTLIQAEFVIGAGTLADVTASTGSVILETISLP
jgi:hypothetical protein